MENEVRFHEQASAEYEAAFEWYCLRSEFAVSRFAQEMSRAVQQIAVSPKRWPVFTPATRRFLLNHFPFAVIYREYPGGVQILAVAHARRKPGYGRGRL